MFFFVKQKTAYEMRISDWSSDVCSSDLWALRFEAKARELMLRGDHQALVDYEALGRDAELSIPTPDHYLPLLYVLGASDESDAVTRSEERRVGQEWVSTCRYRWSRSPYKKKHHQQTNSNILITTK